MPLPLCATCQRRRVKRPHLRFCSPKCSNARFIRLKPKCAYFACQNRVHQRVNRYCSKRCAWFGRNGAAAAARGRPKALAVRRAQYIARLKVRLQGMTSAAQIWKAAYYAGYNAMYQNYLRKIRRGDVIVVKERTRLTKADAA